MKTKKKEAYERFENVYCYAKNGDCSPTQID